MGRSKRKKTGSDVSKDRTLYVKGFPFGTTESVLKQYFQEFGELEKIDIPEKLSGRVAFVVFKNKSSCENLLALKQHHEIDGYSMQLSPLFNSSLKLPLSEKVLQEAICKVEQTCRTVAEQIACFTTHLTLTPEDINIRESIRQEILYILRGYYRHCQIFIFGSTVNNFGSRGCDLDLLLLPFPGYFESTPLASECEASSSYNLQREEILYHINNMFRKLRLGFSQSIFIEAKCPLVNFCHHQSGLRCDLSCSNMLSVYNSELLHFYTQLDSRLVPLVMIIRTWAKRQNFAVKGSFTSYAISWLVIFYLQNINPHILPPVEELMSLASGSRLAAGFETAFCDDINQYVPSSNDTPVEILLGDFFLFYVNFDFSLVICPRTGKALTRESLPHLENTRKETLICVEDPFCTTRNITGNVNVYKFLEFFSSLKIGLTFYHHNSKPCADSWGISQLFVPRGLDESIHFKPQIDVSFPLHCQMKNRFSFNLIAHDDLFRLITGSTKRELRNMLHWVEIATAAILYIFNDVLFFDANIVNYIIKEPEEITLKLESSMQNEASDHDSNEKKTYNEEVAENRLNSTKQDDMLKLSKDERFNVKKKYSKYRDRKKIKLSHEGDQNIQKPKIQHPLIDNISRCIVKLEVQVSKNTWMERWKLRSFSFPQNLGLLHEDKCISMLLSDCNYDEINNFFVCKLYFYNRRNIGFELSCDDDNSSQLHLLHFLKYFLVSKLQKLFSEDVCVIKSHFLNFEMF